MKIKVKTNNIITQKQLENGIWTFMLDHAEILDENLYQVRFPITTKDDLMRRIYARATGFFVVKDKDTLDKKIQRKIADIRCLRNERKNKEELERRIDKLPKTKRFLLKILKKLEHKIIY